MKTSPYRRDLESKFPIQLSSNYTKLYAIGGAVVFVPIIILVLLFFDRSKGTPTSHFIGTAGLLVLAGLIIYQLILAAEATLSGKTLYLKKIVGKKYEINVNGLQKVSTFSTRKTKYTFIQFLDDENKTQRALIINANSIFLEEEDTAGDIIKEAQTL